MASYQLASYKRPQINPDLVNQGLGQQSPSTRYAPGRSNFTLPNIPGYLTTPRSGVAMPTSTAGNYNAAAAGQGFANNQLAARSPLPQYAPFKPGDMMSSRIGNAFSQGMSAIPANPMSAWTVDDYAKYGSGTPYTGDFAYLNNTTGGSRPVAASSAARGTGNSSAAYTPRLNSQSPAMAAGAKSYNKAGSTLNGYGPSLAAMNTGGYSTAMGAAVTGLPVYNQMGQQVSNSGGGMPAYGSGPFVKNGNTYTPDGNGGYSVTAGASAMPAAQPQVSQAQAFFNDVQNQANTAKQKNETRYDAILNRDQESITPDFLSWLKEQNPRAAKDINVLNKLVADPKMQEAYRATDRFASFGGYRDRYTRGMNNLKGWGQQQLADNQEQWNVANNKAQMSLAKKGLLGSTVGSSVAAGMQREAGKDTRRIQEDIQMRNYNADRDLSGDTLGFMERRNDTYPDQMAMAGLAQQLGLFNGGGGYSSAGGGGGGMPTLQYSGTYSRNGMPARGFGAPSYRGF